jgi:hypothetical protein
VTARSGRVLAALATLCCLTAAWPGAAQAPRAGGHHDADSSGAPVFVTATAVNLSAGPPAISLGTVEPAGDAATDVPLTEVLLKAYQSAVDQAPAACHLPVSLLAAIGEVESGSLVGRPLDTEHRTSVLGPVLDGHGYAAVPDSDDGRVDGDSTWDRAVGPMQFLPSTWRRFGADGDGDGVADPQDVEDAAAGAAAYLCYGSRDLADPQDVRSAVLAYNHSQAYVDLVLTYQQRFHRLGLDGGGRVVGTSFVEVPLAVPEAAVATARRPASQARASGVPSPVADPTTRPSQPSTPVAGPAHPTSTPTATPTRPVPSASSSPTTSGPEPPSPEPSVVCGSATSTPSASPSEAPTLVPTTSASPEMTPAADATATIPDPCQGGGGSDTNLRADLGQAPTASLAAPNNESSTGPDSTG